MRVIATRHMRIARAIEQFWGYRECVEYMQGLVLNGDNENGHRMGFKPEVMEALLELIVIHQMPPD